MMNPVSKPAPLRPEDIPERPVGMAWEVLARNILREYALRHGARTDLKLRVVHPADAQLMGAVAALDDGEWYSEEIAKPFMTRYEYSRGGIWVLLEQFRPA